jgi:hypothetical protein
LERCGFARPMKPPACAERSGRVVMVERRRKVARCRGAGDMNGLMLARQCQSACQIALHACERIIICAPRDRIKKAPWIR